MSAKTAEAQAAEMRIVTKPAFTVAGMRYRGDNANNEIPQLWGQFNGKMGILPGRVDNTTCYGVCANFDEATKEFDYTAACEIAPGAELPEGMVALEIPAQTYAVFETTLPRIHETMEQIDSVWLPASEHERADGPELELYGETFNPNDPASTFSIYVPIK